MWDIKVIIETLGFQDSKNSTQASLFGESTGVKLPEPLIPDAEEWGNIYALNK